MRLLQWVNSYVVRYPFSYWSTSTPINTRPADKLARILDLDRVETTTSQTRKHNIAFGRSAWTGLIEYWDCYKVGALWSRKLTALTPARSSKQLNARIDEARPIAPDCPTPIITAAEDEGCRDSMVALTILARNDIGKERYWQGVGRV